MAENAGRMKNNPIRGSHALILGTVLALLALWPAVASASTVSKSGSTLTYNAAAGETNSVVVSLANGVYTVDDSGATIGVGAGCTTVNAHRATCPGSGVTGITINAGDGNDVAWVTAATPATITGADGNDTLIGGNANDVLIGCTGNDSLNGGGGADVLADTFFNCAGGGNDTFDGGTGPDSIYGGPGTDTVTYASRTAPVFVTLDGSANDGEAGEGDNVSPDVENITGGSGGDELSGGPGANTLSGGGGDDVIVGEANPDPSGPGGNDTILGGTGDDALNGGDGNNLIVGNDGDDMIEGGSGTDSVDAGAGDDQLDTLDGVVDSVNCGAGFDSGQADTVDAVSPSCEAVDKLTADSSDPGDFTDFGGDFPTDCGDGGSSSSGGDTGGDPGDFDGLAATFGGDGSTDSGSTDTGSSSDGSDCLGLDVGCLELRVAHHKAQVHHGDVAIRVSLPAAGDGASAVTCKGKLKLSLAPTARKAGAKKVRIGSGTFSVRSGKSKKVTVAISKPGRRLIVRSSHLPVRAVAFVNGGGQSTKVSSTPIVLQG
jgi:Ca2+-binding RTX toxin-like protein